MNFWLIINAATQYTYTQKKEKKHNPQGVF